MDAREFHEHLEDANLGRLVAVAGHVLTRRWSGMLAEGFGLTMPGASLVMVLERYGPMTHRDVAQRMYVRPATLTGIVDTLARSGYVERIPDPDDRRTVRLALTEAGTQRAKRLRALVGSRTALTSVDADPEREKVIREFLMEIVCTYSNGEGRA